MTCRLFWIILCALFLLNNIFVLVLTLSRYCNGVLVSQSNSSDDLRLLGETPLVLASGRLYPIQFTFQGSLSLLGFNSIRVYAVVGNAPVVFDSMSSYFSNDKRIMKAMVSAGPVSASRSEISPSTSVVTAGQFFSFSILLRDQYGNSVNSWKGEIVFTSSNSSHRHNCNVDMASSLSVALTISGVYSMALLVPLSSVSQIFAHILVVGANVQIANSEFKFTSSIATAGLPVIVMFVARDSFGNELPIRNYDELPQIIVDQSNQNDHRFIGSLIFANSSLFAVFTSSGQYRAVLTNKYGVLGNSFNVNVMPSTVCMSLVAIYGSGLSVATNGLPSRFSILARDRYGNTNSFSKWAAFESSPQKYMYLKSSVVGSEIRFVRKPGLSYESISLSVFAYAAGPLTATFYQSTHFASPFSVDDVEVNAPHLDTLSNKIFQSKSLQIAGFVRTNKRLSSVFAFSDCHSTCTRVRIDGVAVYSCDAVTQLDFTPGTWIFLQIEHACLQITSANSFVARQIIEQSISSAFLSSVSTFRVNHAVGSPFQIFSSPGYPFSPNFVAQGTGLSVCTFGMSATFAISIRDLYFAPASLSGSLVEFIAIGRNSSSATPTVLSCRNSKTASNICNFSYNCDSKYFKIYLQKTLVPGLVGEYHETMSFKDYLQPSAVQGFSRVEYIPSFEDEAFLPFTLSDRLGLAPNKTFGSQFFSVRWTGLIQSQFSEVHTFQCSSSGALKVFVDGVAILSKRSTPQRQVVQGTISLIRSAFVDIRIDYAHNMGPYGMKLEWQSRSQPISDVPISALWHSESDSLPEFVVNAVAGSPLLSGSKLSGAGLTIATAGIAAQFTVSVSDSIGLPADLNKSQILALAQSLGGPTISPIRQTHINSNAVGNYVISYTPSFVGEYNFEAMYMMPGSLVSTLYASSLFLQPVTTAGSVGLSLDSSFYVDSFQGASFSSRVSVSWAGFFKPANASITTFRIQLGSVTDKVKLAVDGVMLVDKMIPATASVASMLATISLPDSNSFYDISIDFAHTTGSLKFLVETQYGPIPTSQLFFRSAMGSSAPTLVVRAASACATTSKVMGAGAIKQLGSGIRSNLELHIRDAFNNPTSIGMGQVHASAYSASCTDGTLQCDSAVSFVSNPISHSVWNVAIHLTRSGKWSVAVALSQPGFLSATFYSFAGFSTPIAAAPVSLNTKPKSDYKSMRMSGFIRPVDLNSNISFKWLADHVFYPSLYIADSFGGQRSANYTKSPNISAVINSTSNIGRFYELNIDAPHVHPGFQASLLWNFENESWVSVPSQRLFTREEVDRFSIDVIPARSCASTSYVVGRSVTIATCGVDISFSIYARDEYSNAQSSIQDRWIAHAMLNDTTVSLVTSDPSNNNYVILPGFTKIARHSISGKSPRPNLRTDEINYLICFCSCKTHNLGIDRFLLLQPLVARSPCSHTSRQYGCV